MSDTMMYGAKAVHASRNLRIFRLSGCRLPLAVLAGVLCLAGQSQASPPRAARQARTEASVAGDDVEETTQFALTGQNYAVVLHKQNSGNAAKVAGAQRLA